MASTYVPIATTTLGSASTIVFNSIPSTYTDLRLIFNGIGGSSNLRVTFNGVSGTSYSYASLYGNGSSAFSSTAASTSYCPGSLAAFATYNQFVTFDIFSYSGSTNKTTLISNYNDQNGTGGTVEKIVCLFRSTSAISSITLSAGASGNLNIGTTATIYGILRA